MVKCINCKEISQICDLVDGILKPTNMYFCKYSAVVPYGDLREDSLCDHYDEIEQPRLIFPVKVLKKFGESYET